MDRRTKNPWPMTSLPPDLRPGDARKPNILTERNSNLSLLARKRKLEDIVGFVRFHLREGTAPEAWSSGFQYQVEQLYSDPEAWADITPAHFIIYLEYMQSQGYSQSTINRTQATFNYYIRCAEKAGALPTQYTREQLKVKRFPIDHDQAKRAKTLRAPKRTTPIELSDEQVTRLLIRPNTFSGAADAVLVCLMAEHGLRVGQLRKLLREDLDLDMRILIVAKERRQPGYTINLRDITVQTLHDYLVWHPVDQGYLINLKPRSKRPMPVSDRTIFARIRALGAEIGIPDLAPGDLHHYWLRKR